MNRASVYACKFSEGDKSYESLVALFKSAIQEGANRERARCAAAMRTYHSKHAHDLDDMPSWDVLHTYIEVITPNGQPGRSASASPL